jgi:nucleotide-binding universal stress UspA family protein
MPSKILIANDGSDGAFKALATALSLAEQFGLELHMICVETLPLMPASIDEVIEEQEEYEQRFHAVIDRAKTLAKMRNVDLVTHVVPGHPVPAIIELIQKQGIDHLVIGFMGHSAIYNRIIGGKSDRLVRLAPCTVTVVK